MTSTTAIPTYDQVTLLSREYGPVVVPPEYQDENGHMNVRHYYDLTLLAMDAVFQRLGITDDYRARRGQGFFTAEHHIKFFAETHVGHQLSLYYRSLERSDKVVHGMAFLVNDSTRLLACTLEVVAVHVDLTTRRTTPFAADLAEIIDRSLRNTDTEWAAPVCGAMGIRR